MLQRERAVYLLPTSSSTPHVSRGGHMHANREPRANNSIHETCAAGGASPEPFLPTPMERRARTGPGFGLTRAGMGTGAKNTADPNVAACVKGCAMLLQSRIVRQIALQKPLPPPCTGKKVWCRHETSRIGKTTRAQGV
jgi:hypothetical protein